MFETQRILNFQYCQTSLTLNYSARGRGNIKQNQNCAEIVINAYLALSSSMTTMRNFNTKFEENSNGA